MTFILVAAGLALVALIVTQAANTIRQWNVGAAILVLAIVAAVVMLVAL